MKNGFWRIGVIIAACVVALTFAADDKPAEKKDQPAAKDEAGDAAWAEVLKAMRAPNPPAEWQTKEPSKEEIAAWELKNGVLAGQAAERALEFYTKHPTHEKAAEARKLEVKLLTVSIELGSTNKQARLDELMDARLKDPTVPADEKFDLRAQRILKMIMDVLTAKESPDRMSVLANAEKQTRALQTEFPKREESFELWMMIARGYMSASQLQTVAESKGFAESESFKKGKAIIADVAKTGQGDFKDQAVAQLKMLGRLGKPIDVKFSDLDEKDTGIKKLAGQVVLVDFWATWCPPCRAALPEVKETYAKLHEKGFEILGISLDKDKSDLTKLLADEKMTWPQYFDGLGWENKFAVNFEISSVPTMWLVDKKGVLRDLNGGDSMAAKVEQLLAEK
jgi:thiol-disulfide isomerase/thioredoxin